jgi:lipopolysaccharide export system protein LptC
MKKRIIWLIVIIILIIAGIIGYNQYTKSEQKENERDIPEYFLSINNTNIIRGHTDPVYVFQEFTGTIYNTAKYTKYHNIVVQISYSDKHKSFIDKEVFTLNQEICPGKKNEYKIISKRRKVFKDVIVDVEVVDANFTTFKSLNSCY